MQCDRSRLGRLPVSNVDRDVTNGSKLPRSSSNSKTKTFRRKTMTEKAVVPVETAQVLSNGHTPAPPDYKTLPWESIQTTPTNPRRRINEQTIDSLADSIRTQGVLEPLIVRQAGKKYEIVCGERRYRAAKVAAVTDIPCLLRELSDEQVLDIQIHEN